MDTGTSCSALKIPKMMPANRTPRPSWIQRVCCDCGRTGGSIRRYTNMMARPTKPRNSANVSTSTPAANTISLRTSVTPNESAAMMPGARSCRRARALDESIRLAMDQRAGAVVGQQLEQDRVLDLAVDDDDALDALLDRIETGFNLRDHAAGNGA